MDNTTRKAVEDIINNITIETEGDCYYNVYGVDKATTEIINIIESLQKENAQLQKNIALGGLCKTQLIKWQKQLEPNSM